MSLGGWPGVNATRPGSPQRPKWELRVHTVLPVFQIWFPPEPMRQLQSAVLKSITSVAFSLFFPIRPECRCWINVVSRSSQEHQMNSAERGKWLLKWAPCSLRACSWAIVPCPCSAVDVQQMQGVTSKWGCRRALLCTTQPLHKGRCEAFIQ